MKSPHTIKAATVALLVGALIACANQSKPAPSPADSFFASLWSLCGSAYAGRIIANQPPSDTPDPFDGKSLVMHVMECHDNRLKIPFHVGDDHSRTWVITRLDQGLRLKHDHRHEDGSPDAVTLYGGDTATSGTTLRQEFPVDNESIMVFKREGLDASITNTWAMELDSSEKPQSFIYELSRPGGRLFQVEFDLTETVYTPVDPW